MIYTELKDGIYIPNTPDFNIKDTLECGQVFRFKSTPFGFIVYSGLQKAEVYCQKEGTKIICEDKKYFINYFDLLTDYAKIKVVLKQEHNLGNALEFGKGIRILKQNPLETLISFIISANNNIPRIKNIINKLCEGYGEYKNDYYAFPTLNQLAKIDVNYFRQIGCGYRSEYLVETINALKTFDLNTLYNLPTSEARKVLMQFKGVGRKVADCVLLFAYGKTDVFPTDTWILQAYEQIYGIKEKNAVKVSEIFSKQYGKLAGYAQQYMFYAKRENNNF